MDFYKPTLKRNDMDCVLRTMVDEQIGPGEKQIEFTQAFSSAVDKACAEAFRTYPDAIKCAFKLLGLAEGSTVAMSPLTPSVYEDVCKECGINIVLVEISKENGCPLESAVSASGADALLLYEAFGTLPMKFDDEASTAVKCDYGAMPVIEDVTESIGSRINDIKAGDWGSAVVCSFEQDCIVSSAGGAAVSVGMDLMDQLKANRPSKYLRMPDMNAALGLIQLADSESNSDRRRTITKGYQMALSKTSHKQFGFMFLDFQSCCSGFSVLLSTKPDESIKFASKKGIPVNMSFCDSIAASFEGDLFESCPTAAACYNRCLSFPVYPFMKAQDLDVTTKVISHLP